MNEVEVISEQEARAVDEQAQPESNNPDPDSSASDTASVDDTAHIDSDPTRGQNELLNEASHTDSSATSDAEPTRYDNTGGGSGHGGGGPWTGPEPEEANSVSEPDLALDQRGGE